MPVLDLKHCPGLMAGVSRLGCGRRTSLLDRLEAVETEDWDREFLRENVSGGLETVDWEFYRCLILIKAAER